MSGPGNGRKHPGRNLTLGETALFCLAILAWPISLLVLCIKEARHRPKWRYYIDNGWPPVGAFLILGVSIADGIDAQWFAWCAFGGALFTFVEYWVHRSLLHRWFYHGTHERHHTHPNEMVVFPLWYVPTIMAGFWLVLPLSVFCGFLIGYCWFIWWHHALHFWQLDRHPWVRAYANWHNLHHAGLPCNYGITVPVWDFVFGTYRRVLPRP